MWARGRASTCASTAIRAGRGGRPWRGSARSAPRRPSGRSSVRRLCEHTFVRWDSQKVEAEEARTLPGYRDDAVVRRFDAPEALDTRFYEVRAKSALNRVPEQSQVPFRWTVNPYRGCSHACVYCMGGDTPILMADGRTKALEDVRPGDAIYGTVRTRFYRRYVETEVRNHWQ